MAFNNSVDIKTQIQRRKKFREKRGRNPDIEPRSKGSFPLMIERQYERKKVAQFNEAALLVKQLLIPQIPSMVEQVNLVDTRQDSYVEDFEAIIAGIKIKFAEVVTKRIIESDAEDMANNVDNRNAQIFDMQVKQVTGVLPFRSEPWLKTTLYNSVSQNVSLIKTLHEDYFKDIEFETLNGLERGLSTNEIAKRIQKKTGASRNGARLIARDQVSKLNSNLASRRASDLGIKRFRWSASSDERVRASHRALNNKIFTYKDGASVDGEDHVLPGQPIRCRCVAVPIISSIGENQTDSGKKISSKGEIERDISAEKKKEPEFRRKRQEIKGGKAPKKATPKKATPKKATPKKATPKKATPKKIENKKTIPILEKEFKDIKKEFKSADKRVESLGNKFDKNPSEVNKKALLAAIKNRDALKIKTIESELSLLKAKVSSIK